jgi:hypothetical protein
VSVVILKQPVGLRKLRATDERCIDLTVVCRHGAASLGFAALSPTYERSFTVNVAHRDGTTVLGFTSFSPTYERSAQRQARPQVPQLLRHPPPPNSVTIYQPNIPTQQFARRLG